jgi:hypothetical protein
VKCSKCKRDINRGTELTKSVAEYQQADGTIKVYGFDREDGDWQGPDAHPTGRLFRAWHYKCFRVSEKRERRGGDAVSGRGMGAIPTAYEITALTANQDELAMLGISEEQAKTMNTQALTDRVMEARRQAAESGEGADSWVFKEKQRAADKGGPYDHTHMIKLEDFQLKPHLLYAHGVEPLASAGGRQHQHAEIHAKMALEKTQASRRQDPGYAEPRESDWRDQTVVEVGAIAHPEKPEETIAGTGEDQLGFEDL